MTRLANRRAAQMAIAGLAAVLIAGLVVDPGQCRGEVLPRAPRELENRLRMARGQAASGRYSDAVLLLETILTGPEDGFVTPAATGLAQRTLKTEAADLLAALPPAGLEVYETCCGSKARQLLKAAARDRDREALARVARQYPCTLAGSEAMLLLGYDGLDRGRPREALGWLKQLARAPALARRFQPELTLTTAVAALICGRADQARLALGRLESLGSGMRFRIGDEEFNADADPDRLLDILGRVAGDTLEQRPAAVKGWPMFRGDAARRASSDWSGSVGPLLWKVDSVGKAEAGKTNTAVNALSRSRGAARPPASHPLVVGSLALARTPRRLIAIDLASGRQAWEYPWGGDPDLKQPQTSRSRISLSSLNSTFVQRLYDDAPYGQLASDGQLLFLLDGLSAAGSRSMRVMVVNGQRVISRAQPNSHNRLVALALEKEGKLVWSVGAESGEDEPQLAGAFLLGPPLVHRGRLYAMAEIGGEIRLCVLDTRTGRQLWSLLLAIPETPVLSDPQRRLAGATPSLADGVLVCPTSAGAVVAVDLDTRSILWGHPYPAVRNSTKALRLRMAGIRVGSTGSAQTTSLDASATIHDGRVLLAPVESNELMCLDLEGGELLWKRPVDDLLSIGGVHGETVLCVGSRSLSAWHLQSGKPAWQDLSVPLPDAAATAGCGVLCGGHYYLPTTAPEILQIDVAAGRVAKRHATKSLPGNLIALGSLLISQSAAAIEAFGQAAPRSEE